MSASQDKLLTQFATILKELGEAFRSESDPLNVLIPKFLWNRAQKAFKSAMANHETASNEVGRLGMFVKHLKEVHLHDSGVFAQYKTKLEKCATEENFVSLRFEIDTAASLARKQVPFRVALPPDADFAVQWGKVELAIECGSARVSADKDYDLTYKVLTTIRKKSVKPYCGLATALFIDCTNLLHSLLKSKVEEGIHRAVIQKSLSKCEFGAVLLFSLHFKNSCAYWSYCRIDSEAIEASLLDFLDSHYARNPSRTAWPSFPDEA